MDGEFQEAASSPAPAAEAPAPVATAAEQPAQEQASDTGDARPEGWDQVPLSPDQQKRFNRVFKELKDYQRETHELKDINGRLIQTVDQLQKSQGEIITHLQNADYTDAEANLKNARRQAYERGDMDAVDSANDKLNEIRVQKLLSEKEQKQQRAAPVQPQAPISGGDVITMAVKSGAISPDEANIYRSWMSETDDTGSLRRPWVNTDDVRNSAAAFEGRAVFGNPAYANKPFSEKLKEIDRRMGIANSQNSGQQQNVLGAGNLTRPSKPGNVKLTPWQEQVAVRTKFGGSKAKSDADHIAAYEKAVLKTKGSRK